MLPSIPGFGFSGPTKETGWEHRRVAAAFAEVMRRLGYRRYGACGGDWGSVISRELGRTCPDQVIGVHLTVLPGSAADTQPDEQELAPLPAAGRERTWASWERSKQWDRDRAGYAAIQSTRPQTLAYGLTDSPVGQLAWIAEKFKDWTDAADRPEDTVDRASQVASDSNSLALPERRLQGERTDAARLGTCASIGTCPLSGRTSTPTLTILR